MDHAFKAAENCITNGNIDRTEIDVVINTGVFRDYNLFEPSVAILIQRKLGISTGYSNDKHVLSFDLMNGACGFLYAAQAADSIFRSTSMRKALLISSDSHPSREKVPGFPYSHLGAAMVLEWDENSSKGFEKFEFKTGVTDFNGVDAYMDTMNQGSKGRESISIRKDDNYVERLSSFAVQSIEEYLKSTDMAAADLKGLKLLTTQPAENFRSTVAGAIDSIETVGENMYKKYGDVHSSALNVAYHDAFKEGMIQENDRLLFSASGAGLTSGTVLYNN